MSHWRWPYCYTVLTETWPITEANRKHLEGFHHNCLRRILNISWKDKVNNDRVRRKTDQSLLECTFQKRRLSWFGHVQHMENVSHTMQTLHWIPAEKSQRGRLRITWRDRVMKDISQMNVTWDGICQTAMDRQEWRLWTAQCASHWKD